MIGNTALERCWRIQSTAALNYRLNICLDSLTNQKRSSFRTVTVSAETWTRILLNISQNFISDRRSRN